MHVTFEHLENLNNFKSPGSIFIALSQSTEEIGNYIVAHKRMVYQAVLRLILLYDCKM